MTEPSNICAIHIRSTFKNLIDIFPFNFLMPTHTSLDNRSSLSPIGVRRNTFGDIVVVTQHRCLWIRVGCCSTTMGRDYSFESKSDFFHIWVSVSSILRLRKCCPWISFL